MQCAWESYLKILPDWMRADVDKHGKHSLQELRMRLNHPVELVTVKGSVFLHSTVSAKDIHYCINAASGYSPWSAETICNGYITAPGGHRIGICGEVVNTNGAMTGIRNPTMLCIRVARDFIDIAKGIPFQNNSVLIIGPPGCGKTTLLRDLIRTYAQKNMQSICVIDERGELFPLIQDHYCFPTGNKADILTGCRKKDGIQVALRCMGPGAIAVDEITAAEDCTSLIQAGWCGVHLFATAHAASRTDLVTREIYKPLLETKLFDTLVVLRRDKTWTAERMNI